MLDLVCRQHGLSEPIPIVFSYVECHNTCNISTVLLFLFLFLDECAMVRITVAVLDQGKGRLSLLW